MTFNKLRRSGTAKTQYYDRNTLIISNMTNVIGPTAPHGSTTRASYTVPANRTAMVTSVCLEAYRATVAGTPSFFGCTGNIGPTTAHRAEAFGNTIDARVSDTWGGEMVIQTGQTATVADYDNSTGGTCTFITNLFVIEFDKN